jgi:hypothetical protein
MSSARRRSPDELALALSGPLAQWARAVEAERERLTRDELDADLQQADAALLVVAVRNVVRVARSVAALRKDPQLDAAIAAIDAAVPGAKSVRGVLEHVDEYRAHRGRLRPSHGTVTGERVRYERAPGRPVLYIGELAFDADVAADATRDLAAATSSAIDRLVAAEARG